MAYLDLYPTDVVSLSSSSYLASSTVKLGFLLYDSGNDELRTCRHSTKSLMILTSFTEQQKVTIISITKMLYDRLTYFQEH